MTSRYEPRIEVSLAELRTLVDKVHGYALEDNSVPATYIVDRLIKESIPRAVFFIRELS